MSDALLPEPVQRYIREAGLESGQVTALTPDASDRRYYRVTPGAAPSIVLALYAQPFADHELPFVNVTELFAQLPVPVPRILDTAPAVGVLALEDLGDVTLQAQLTTVDDTTREALYRRALDHIVVMQQRGRVLADRRYLPYTLAFDEAKLMWELEFFITHFLGQYRGLVLPAPTLAALRAACAALAAELAALPQVLCHRDYHSRNLMVHDGDLYVIDHQDARLGPDTYDLVSLLRDSYVELPEALVTSLAHAFAHQIGECDLDGFDARFRLMAVQRNLKALGTFGYQATARANPAYAQYVPRTLGYVRQNLRKDPRVSGLGAILGDLLPELA